ncbi:MAG TPA: tRNA pseudouridine(55) synthase TruB [Candidatus Saccharimonadales bacterium]|nr:tRNA pseudouridine(55) synthase TruB [Candidatus Saccharimonadales bacterium]
MDGILLVDKPPGWTSHDVVAKARSIIKAETGQKVKVGHTGTLDPMATGLLVIVIGSYTKKAQEFSKLDKIYEAELTLGATSTTGDGEGEITPKSAQQPSEQAVTAVLSTFLGEISQTPPQYSAVKIGGQRAYQAARAGKTVKIEPRKVRIYEITDVKYEYPKLNFTCKVSSGTYIRSLGEDIGKALGTGAYLSALRRTQAGRFSIKKALKIDDLSLPVIKNNLQK